MQELHIEENVAYLETLFSLLGDKNRLLILQSLMEGERNVGELQTLLQTSQANVSKHLRKLREGKLVLREKRGTQTYHTLACEVVLIELVNLAIHAKNTAADDAPGSTADPKNAGGEKHGPAAVEPDASI